MGCNSTGKKAVSASALAQMGVCERLVIFEHFDGKHPTPAQQDALQRGLRAHRRFASCRTPIEARAGPCGAATPDFGERPEPQVLWLLPDRTLRLSRAGRRLMLTCYCLVLSLSRSMKRSPTRPLVALLALAWLAMLCLGSLEAVLVR